MAAETAGDSQREALNQFLELARARRSTRHFRPEPVPSELLDTLLEAARWAPSGFNLQPTHFVVVTDEKVKKELCRACMNQRQVLEAGATVVFTGDRKVVPHHFERVLEQDRQAGAMNEEYERLLRKTVPLSFGRGPWGIGWIWKAVVEAVAERFVPIPNVQAVHMNYWLAKQVSLAAMSFLLAAELAGLATCPMEGFGETAVRRVLNIPADQAVILVIPVGYADNSRVKKTRLPLAGRVHRQAW